MSDEIVKKRGRPKKSTDNKFVDSKLKGKSVQSKERIEYRGELRIIGQIVNSITDTIPIGYVIMVEKTHAIRNASIEQTKILLKKCKFVNAKLENDKIVNTECSMDKLVKFDRNRNVLEKDKLTVLGEIVITDGDFPTSYRILNENGRIVDVSEDDLVKLVDVRGYTLVNAKTVHRDNKTYVSGIKSDFTKIEKSKADNMKYMSESRKDRYVRHREKLMDWVYYWLNEYTYNVNHYNIGCPIDTHVVITGYEGNILYRYLQKDARILLKEVLYYNINNAKDKELLSSIYRKTSDIPEKIMSDYSYNIAENVYNIFAQIYQFGLSIPKVSKHIYSLLEDKVKYNVNNNCYNVRKYIEFYSNLLKYKDDILDINNRGIQRGSDFSNFLIEYMDSFYSTNNIIDISSYQIKSTKCLWDIISDDFKCSELKILEIKYKELYTKYVNEKLKPLKELVRENKETIEKLKGILNSYEFKMIYKNSRKQGIRRVSLNEFKKKLKILSSTSFSKASEIADLGFAISEKNRDLAYKTKYGPVYKLKYLGDFIPDYKIYKDMAETFGDICSIAQIEKTLTISDEDKYKRVEIIMGIMSIYRPDILKVYVENRLSKMSDIHLQEIINNFDFDEFVDYKLDSKLKLYYDSGFNAYYTDVKKLKDRQGVFRDNNAFLELKNVKDSVVSYRALYPKNEAISSEMFEELVTVLGLIVSENCSYDDIYRLIGRLRQL